jgi:hypothetical protein
VVKTPALPAGHFVVTADFTVTESEQGTPDGDQDQAELDCWVTPNRAGASSNRDGVRIVADIGTATQTLSFFDVLTTATPDQIDLACSVSPVGPPDMQVGTITHAVIIATEVTHAATATATASELS